MIRVVVIEDRVLLLNALRDCLPWQENGLEPIGFFENCDEALPVILSEKPDVVITDIVMHGLSGIDLCAQLRQAGLDTKVILISAYGQFEYAQRALQMGVFDYFEKPVDYAALVASVRRAGEERRSAEKIQQYMANHMAFYRERFIVKLLSGQITDNAAIESEAAFLNLDAERRMCCLVLTIHPLRGGTAPLGMRREMIALSLAKQMLVALGEDSLLGPYSLHEDDVVLVLLSGAAYEDAPENVREQLWRIIESYADTEKLRICAGLGREVYSLQSLKHSYDSAEEASGACYLFADSALLCQSDMPPGDGGQWRGFYRFEEALIKALHQGDSLAVGEAFEQLREDIHASYIPGGSLKVLMKSALIKTQAVHPLEDTLFSAALSAMDSAPSADELIETARNLTQRVSEAVRSSALSELKRLIDAMRQYADAHYTDPEFSLATLSRHVAMSPNYVSSLFKRECGVGLHEYVVGLRIGRARQLLTQTDTAIGRIGEMVGYPNPDYFSVNFKKTTGFSPTEYRRRNQSIPKQEE